MCWCNPKNWSTPCCGGPACHPPTQSPPPPDAAPAPVKLAEVKQLYSTNARDIPAMLRKLADELEDPPMGRDALPDCAVCVLVDSTTGRLNVYGWGDATIDQSIAYLDLARLQLLRVRHGGNLWPIPVGGVK